MQGLCKFGFYEMFKDLYMNLAGEENSERYKGLIWLAGSASADSHCDEKRVAELAHKVAVEASRIKKNIARDWDRADKTSTRSLGVSATRGFEAGQVVYLRMRASTGLGTFSFSGATFELAKLI